MTAAAIDTGNVSEVAYTGGNPVTFNNTCGASDNLLVVMEINANTTAFNPPTGVTYNSVGMTQCAGSPYQFNNSLNGQYLNISFWELQNPPTGSAHQVSVTYTSGTGISAAICVAIPISGARGTFGTLVGAGTAANNHNPAVTAMGAGANDLYLGGSWNTTSISTANGTNQTSLENLLAQTDTVVSFDTIPGSSPGAFSWAGSGTAGTYGWAAAALAVFGPSTGLAAPGGPFYLSSDEYF